MEHIPVLLKETIDLLAPNPGENFVDCTLGFGGHAAALHARPAGVGLHGEREEQAGAHAGAGFDCPPAAVHSRRRPYDVHKFRNI